MEVTQVIKNIKTLKIDNKKIIVERALKNWTKSKLSEEAGVARKTLTKIEKGTAKNVRISTIEKIAKALGKTIEDLKEN
ncbi:helix-turn-helix transcriptional regulator [Clostridium tyrobutyricum]|uniref:helix-turn-helix transcriptional regulator n=1 Tax=Clostridium tyrobutyricum TaxID=1519 RepID=UPI002B2136F2|nr:helix-turn-helix transcriptional regulator [Clostridium tyrobutyricum]MEA5008225.1 helix-turn-helix transcriptional regulator [Clostridium tyrobutyricum]